MADQVTPPVTNLIIPPETQERFSGLVALIQGSESMNDEERQYWINILPIMTQEQLKNLEEILTSEKQQLAAIDSKYNSGAPAANAGAPVEVTEEKIRERKKKRLATEKAEEAKEAETQDAILSEIESA